MFGFFSRAFGAAASDGTAAARNSFAVGIRIAALMFLFFAGPYAAIGYAKQNYLWGREYSAEVFGWFCVAGCVSAWIFDAWAQARLREGLDQPTRPGSRKLGTKIRGE